MISLTAIAMAAVLYDLELGLIPNALTVTGLAMGLIWQLGAHGILGLLLFLGGALLPVLLLSPLFYFRMIGAGDIKLFMALGGFFGPGLLLSCIVWSIVIAAVFSLILSFRRRIFTDRVHYFLSYISEYADTRKWKPYLAGAGVKSRFCFSVPVLASVILCVIVGG